MNPTRVTRFLRPIAMLVATLVVIAAALSLYASIYHVWDFWDDDPQRGAMPLPQPDKFGEHFDKVVYLDQGWQPQDSLWYYNTSQGSDLMPYDFFMVLEQPDADRPFRDNMNMNNYRYLPQKATFKNPDALPVGFVADTYRGIKYLGLTCAACHSGQVNYQGTAIRIDGGAAGADMETLMEDLARALAATQKDEAKKKRFIDAVMARGYYKSADQVLTDLSTYSQRVATYVVVNKPTTPYRYGRLDAFGRIFNRVLEHLMSAEQLRELLARMPQEVMSAAERDKVMAGLDGVMSATDRDHVIARILPLLSERQVLRLRDQIYNRANAPVSYPYLWDVPHSDRVQWNGIAANAGVGSIGRNAGEVIGVFGTLDWQQLPGWTLSSALGGQGWFSKTHISFESSVEVSSLRRVEHHLVGLRSPLWPQEILGKIDGARAARGVVLYERLCAMCHAEIRRDDDDRRIAAVMTRLEAIRTDPQMAVNSVGHNGYSGILLNHYVAAPQGNLLLQRKAPVAALLISSTQNVVTTPDPDHGLIVGTALRVHDFFLTLRDNEVKPSIKVGDYNPDTAVDPFASLRAYKARPLNGIWATAPYLHNGSVPTLYDLLLPKKTDKDPADGEYRPDVFKVGTREYDPEKVGLRSDVGDPFVTEFPGNGNTGHEYGARSLTREQRLDLVEYLKTL